ncbi:MAG TPA: hypothetical protein VGJ39_07000 [Vicinamibacterales bacterium]|jgi:hypothetical protein
MTTSPKLPPSNVARAAPAIHHETSDANVNAVFAFGLALMLGGALILFLVWLLFGYLTSREARSAVREFPLAAEQQNRLPPEPRLQINPKQDMIDLRAKEDAILNTYGWVDKTGGVVRIPIGEAMRLTVERGLPSRQGNAK